MEFFKALFFMLCSISLVLIGITFKILFFAAFMYVKLLSMPMNFLPSFLQTAPVVPVPKKGSKTNLPA